MNNEKKYQFLIVISLLLYGIISTILSLLISPLFIAYATLLILICSTLYFTKLYLRIQYNIDRKALYAKEESKKIGNKLIEIENNLRVCQLKYNNLIDSLKGVKPSKDTELIKPTEAELFYLNRLKNNY